MRATVLVTLLAAAALITGCGSVAATSDAMPMTTDAPPGMVTLTVASTGTGTVTSSPAGITCGSACTLSVALGTQVTLTATPQSGATFSGWGGGCTGTSATCTVTLDKDTSVTAAFAVAQQSVTVAVTGPGDVISTPGGISCPGTCTTSVAKGTTISLTATSHPGAVFLGWTGTTACSGTGTCTFPVNTDTTINAVFAADQTLVVTRSGNGAANSGVTSVPVGIDCGTTCSHAFPANTTVTLTANPSADATFTGWNGGGCTGTGACTLTVTAAVTVDAEFTLKSYTLTAATSGAGGGVITSNPTGITCGGGSLMCAASYFSGTMVTLTAAPDGNSKFSSWSGDCTGTATTCTVTIDQARTVTATFIPSTYLLTVVKTGAAAALGGVASAPTGISCGATCSGPFATTSTVTLTATAPTGTTFNGWSGGCTGTASTCTVTINAATTVMADFSYVSYVLTTQLAGTGTGSVTSSPAGITCGADCTEPYPYTTAITLTATPTGVSTFTGWTGGGCGTTNPCTLTMPAAATTIKATFAAGIYDTKITSSPLSTTSSTTATFGFASVPVGAAGFECALDFGAFTACTSPTTYSGLAATYHQFQVRAVDVGGTDPTPAIYNWMITGTGPLFPDSKSALCSTGSVFAACPTAPNGQDGDYLINVPTYTVSTSGNLVTDSVTGLMWERNIASSSDEAGALTYCNNLVLDGFTDWRLPSRLELVSITDGGRVGPPFDPTAFPGIPSNSFFRTATPVAGLAGQSWTINTNYPVFYVTPDTDTQPVRCVRLSQGGGTMINYSANTVFDGRTNLYWQKTVVAASAWTSALASCEASTVDGFTDWRLPSNKELATMVDDRVSSPAIGTLFTDRGVGPYWTSTPVPNFANSAYAIDFTRGASANISNAMTLTFIARCVR